jgi:uncharacterized membrane protein
MNWEFIKEHIGKIAGMAIGLILAVLFILVGFWNTLVIVVFVTTGFYLGRKYDNREDFTALLDRILPGKYTKL